MKWNQLLALVFFPVLLSIISCNPRPAELPASVILTDTLQFESYSDEYDYPMAFFINPEGDTIQFLADSAIDVSAEMSVFHVQYKLDSVEEAGEGAMVTKFRLLKMQLLDGHPQLIQSKDKNKQAFFDLTNQWPVFCVLAKSVEDYNVLLGIVKTSPQSYSLIPFKSEGSEWVKQEEIVYEADHIQFIEPFQYGLNTDNMHYVYFSTIERSDGTANTGLATAVLCLYDFYTLMKVRCEGTESADNKVKDCTFDRGLQEIDDRGHGPALSFFTKKVAEWKAAQ